jgi:hypothetical protein
MVYIFNGIKRYKKVYIGKRCYIDMRQAMKTSLDIPDDLIERIRKFNDKHPERPIIMSAVVKKCLMDYLGRAEKESETDR